MTEVRDGGVRVARGLALFSVALYLMVSAHSPLAVYANAAHDDALFWKHAQALATGHWQGGFSQYTLMKGVGYPLFLAVNHFSGLPLSVSHALLYCVACIALVTAVRRMNVNAWVALVLFVLLLWHPAVLSWSRATRDSVSAAQVLLFLSCVLHAFYLPNSRRRGFVFAAGAGLVWAWFWMTREDGVWALPGAGLLLLGGLYGDRQRLRRFAEKVAVLAAACLCFLFLVAAVNAKKYGRFELVDFKGGPYENAVAALQSVRVGDAVPYVPVPEKVRKAVYAVSPTFAQLEPYFEETGRGWTQFGCSLYPDTCGDYAGGWFVWALRDAVASVGGYESASKAAEFYGNIGEEVEAACGSGRLQCRRGFPGLMPAVTPKQWQALPARVRDAIAMLVLRTDLPAIHRNSGSEFDQDAMWQFIGRPQPWLDADEVRVKASGWFYSPSEAWLRLRCATGSGPGAPIELPREASPDIARHFGDPDADERRFSFASPAEGECTLEVVSGSEARTVARLHELPTAPAGLTLADGELHFDAVDRQEDPRLGVYRAVRELKQRIERAYRSGLPVLALGGLLALAWAVFAGLRRRRLAALPIVAIAAWCMVACRIAVLALVDISAFPAMHVLYMQPAFPLMLLATVLSLAALFCGDDPAFVRRTRRAAGG